MTDEDLQRIMNRSENIGYRRAKLDLTELILDLHNPSEIAAEVILWIKQDIEKKTE
jgi:hypothetical protein